MNRMFSVFVLLVVIALSVPGIAQERAGRAQPAVEKQQDDDAGVKDTAARKDPSKLWVDLSCLMYMEWAYFTGFKYTGTGSWGKVSRWGIDTGDYLRGWVNPADLIGEEASDYSRKENNSFRLQRSYITVKKRLGEIFSAKITVDIDPKSSDFLYLKYGLIQFHKEFGTPIGPIGLKAQAGKIGTPVVGITNNLNDLRWIGKNYLQDSKIVLNGNTFDHSADLGGMVSLALFKMVTIEYMISNGEGVRSDHNETYAGKAHTLLVSINPVDYLKNITVNFYGRWEDTNKNRLDTTSGDIPIKYQGIDKRNYLGAGIAWYSDYLKAGVNFFAPEMQYSKTIFVYDPALPIPVQGYSPRYRQRFLLIDSWLNFNLGAIVRPAPILIVGRLAWGRELKSLLANERRSNETLVLGGGMGYQFNEHFRIMLYYETIRYHVAMSLHDISKKDPTPNNNVYIKAEVKF